ncbi:hypothetical protein T492DRAFT_847428 [Pavlovales sp. CCMP2436]|nr:hypothetical protein T492DRAFT_847428 [Pavlovales sp. CCMP2436]
MILSGQARDVLNSLTRFVRNNLSDGERQDAYDLFLGGYSLSPARRPTDSLYAAPARTTLLAYAVRCVLAGLVLLAVATVACAQMCEAAEGMAGPEMPFRMRTVASACAWSEVQVHAQWRVGQLLPLLLYLRWCYAALCADVRRFVDMPRLLPAEYEPPAGALVLGSKTIV